MSTGRRLPAVRLRPTATAQLESLQAWLLDLVIKQERILRCALCCSAMPYCWRSVGRQRRRWSKRLLFNLFDASRRHRYNNDMHPESLPANFTDAPTVFTQIQA